MRRSESLRKAARNEQRRPGLARTGGSWGNLEVERAKTNGRVAMHGSPGHLSAALALPANPTQSLPTLVESCKFRACPQPSVNHTLSTNKGHPALAGCPLPSVTGGPPPGRRRPAVDNQQPAALGGQPPTAPCGTQLADTPRPAIRSDARRPAAGRPRCFAGGGS